MEVRERCQYHVGVLMAMVGTHDSLPALIIIPGTKPGGPELVHDMGEEK
jgi:hypothetical protein